MKKAPDLYFRGFFVSPVSFQRVLWSGSSKLESRVLLLALLLHPHIFQVSQQLRRRLRSKVHPLEDSSQPK